MLPGTSPSAGGRAESARRVARWSAPGRVNLIGEHLDYNGGLVLPFAIPQRLTATVRAVEGAESTLRSAELGMARFPAAAEPGRVQGFGSPVAGVSWALRRLGHSVPALEIDVASAVPLGAGLGSSAALGCAVAAAVVELLGLPLAPVDIAQVAHEAERGYAGVPSGVMDQMAAMLCRPGQALRLDCFDLSCAQVPLDLGSRGLALLVVDTGVRHEHATGEYGDRRAQCDEAAAALGLDLLSRATVGDLSRIEDPLLRRRTRHVVTEMERVRAAVGAMSEGRLAELGPLLTASHASLRDDFEVSCPELDAAVGSAVAAGALGARMTGGGFGGCAIALCPKEAAATVEAAVHTSYQQRPWSAPRCWTVFPSAGAHPDPH